MANPPLIPPAMPIQAEALDRWDLLPDSGVTSFTLTKAQLQEAYFAFRDLIDSQAELQQTIIHYSNGNLGFANDALRRSQQRLTDSQSRLNEVMSAIMFSARNAP